ncbi:MAG: hypothetical protein ACLPX1_04625 [Steroidobacteraceae bacterium]
MCKPSCSLAGVWGADPKIGIVGDYSTNAELLDLPHTAQTDGALLLDSPVTYNGDALMLSVLPSFRFSNSTGYSSVTSDYDRLSIKSEYHTERSIVTTSAAVARDSSLYYDYLSNGSAGVQRDSWTADLNWDRSLTERVDFVTDVNSTRVRYGEAVGIPTLTNFRYTSISPSVAWNSSEQNKLTASASVGRYDSLDGTTESRNGNLQLGFARQLTEIWSFTAVAGYSRALNRLDTEQQFLEFTPQGPVIVLVPLTLESAQNGTVYSVNFSRKGTLLLVNATVSRQLVPTGFAYLSLQESAEVSANYSYSDRWSFTADAHYVRAQNPQLQGEVIIQTPKYLGITANWHWTEHWTLSLGASRIMERYSPPTVDISSNEVSITVSRQFDHVKFQ